MEEITLSPFSPGVADLSLSLSLSLCVCVCVYARVCLSVLSAPDSTTGFPDEDLAQLPPPEEDDERQLNPS